MSHPKKKWGQHFLRNRGAVDRIVSAVEPQPDDVIVEIGPGEGALTAALVTLGRKLVAIEIDPDLAAQLSARLENSAEVRNEDALETNFPQSAYRAVGNLPYNVGTPILRRVIADPHCSRAVFMLQKEVADRIVAKPGEEAYGYLTLFVRAYADARIFMTLDPRSFYPPPKVRSAVIVLDPVARTFVADRADLLDLVSASFRMRRKTLVNNLLGWRGHARVPILAGMSAAGIPEMARAEELGLETFDRLYVELDRYGRAAERATDSGPEPPPRLLR